MELTEQIRVIKSLKKLKCFSKRVQFNEGNVIAKTYLPFKYVITLHVVAMARN